MLDVHSEELSLKLGVDFHAWNPSYSGKPRLDCEFEACMGNIMRSPFGGKEKQPEEIYLFLHLQIGTARVHKYSTCLLRAKGDTTTLCNMCIM